MVNSFIQPKDQKGLESGYDFAKKFNAAYEKVEEQDGSEDYKGIVKNFYDIATSFYQWGWGNSFHFGPRCKGETFTESIRRHEHFLGSRLDVSPGQEIMDLGSGVCGPLISISRVTRCRVTGVTINPMQVQIGNQNIKKADLHKTCKVVQGDFHDIPLEANSMDGGYDMEASAHSTNLEQFFREIARVLKPGKRFGGMAWVATDLYDPNDEWQKKVMDDVAYGNALTVIHTFDDYKKAIDAIPELELVEAYDMAKILDHEKPWYDPLVGRFSVENFLATTPGRYTTASLAWFTEKVGIAPSGSYETSQILEKAADGLVKSGKAGLYTPMHFYLVQKKKL